MLEYNWGLDSPLEQVLTGHFHVDRGPTRKVYNDAPVEVTWSVLALLQIWLERLWDDTCYNLLSGEPALMLRVYSSLTSCMQHVWYVSGEVPPQMKAPLVSLWVSITITIFASGWPSRNLFAPASGSSRVS